MKKLNTYLFKKRAHKFLSFTPRDRRFVNYDKAKTILILFESDFSEKNPEIRSIITLLQQDGKKVIAWGYLDKKEITTAILPEFRILHHKQTDFFRKPVASYIEELNKYQFDLLIDLTLQPVIPLLYLSLFANAACKTGSQHTESPIYDFMVNVDNKKTVSESTESNVDALYLFNQIIFYLKSIQTKD